MLIQFDSKEEEAWLYSLARGLARVRMGGVSG
jgi:hypothetical protein